MKKGVKIFLEILNSKPVIGAMIFIMLSLITVWAGNVIVKEGSVTINNNLNSSGVLYTNATTAMFVLGPNNKILISRPGGDTTSISSPGITSVIGFNDGISIGTSSTSPAECALKVRGGLYVGNSNHGNVNDGAIYVDKQIILNNNDSSIDSDPGDGSLFVSGGALYYMGSSGTITKIANA